MRVTRTSRLKSISVTLVVDAEIVRGRLSDEDLAVWVQEALDKYHHWRIGHVGSTMKGSITAPIVTLAE